MVSFLSIFLAFAFYAVVHSWLASLQAKEVARRLLGPIADRVYRLAYNIFALLSLIPVLVLLVRFLPRYPQISEA